MYEYEIYNKKTNEYDFTHGYSIEDMKRRNPNINWTIWEIIDFEYID